MSKNESHVQIVVQTMVIIEHLYMHLGALFLSNSLLIRLSRILDLVAFCGMNLS